MPRYTLIGIVIIIIVAVLSGLWLFARTPVPAFDPPAAPQATSSAPVGPRLRRRSSTATSTLRRTPPAGYTEYRDTTYHLSLFYPSELSLKTYDEGGGAATIDFQSVEKGEGFQIFIVPYAEAQISDARFKEDEPSGVREQLTNIVLDGATGATFYSTDATLGETREVWFVRGGYLYEVTTLRPLDSWLSQIMQTWQFL